MSAVRLVIALSVIAALSVPACSPKYGGSTVEYDSRVGDGADLSVVRTWSFVPTTNLPPQDPRLTNAQFANAIEAGIQRELVARGFARTMEAPDMLVNYQVDIENKIDEDDWVEYYSEQKFSQPGVQWQEGSIILFLFDAKSGMALWAGWARGEMDPKATPAQRRERVQDVIRRIMLEFDTDRGGAPAAN